MTEREPSLMAGYRAALTVEPAALVAIVVPPDYDAMQRTNFVSGFLVGARDRRAQELMDEIRREDAA